ncbi:MAG: alpha-galactosidase [Lentisphaerae bacterium]|nr:alpha-galactosidase [Lentisphaerota bacterium]
MMPLFEMGQWLCKADLGIAELAKMLSPVFIYAGTAFSPATWQATTTLVDKSPAKTEYLLTYTSPDQKLKLEMTTRIYPEYPVVEIRPVLVAAGNENTGMIDDFLSFEITSKLETNAIRIRRVTGAKTVMTDFTRQDAILQRRHECDYAKMTTDEGASSATWLPYFGVDFDPLNGLEVAIGWTGAWKANFQYLGNEFKVTSGLERTHFVMRPGERFVMPSTVVYLRQNKSRRQGAVDFHRFIVNHKSPRDSKGNLFKSRLPITASGGNKTDENMLKIINFAKAHPEMPFDTFWVDAAWYGPHRETQQPPNCGPDWYIHVGDWKVNTWAHPDGNLRKVSDAANAAGLKFLLWFESERATATTPVFKEHPEWFHNRKNNPDPNQNLLDLGNKDAWHWIVETVSNHIKESNIGIYRQDFNMTWVTKRIWEENDEPDRLGVMEIKHINGLYEFWDELRRRFPDMLLENCASGGRRMDIEMMSRSHSYCRDDAHMSPHPEELCQNITLNSTQYIPFTGGETFAISMLDDYGFLSCMAATTVVTPTDWGLFFRKEFSQEEIAWLTRMVKIADRVRPYFQGDFYALTEPLMDSSDIWCAYQLDLPKTNEGFFIAFRRAACLRPTLALDLGNINPDKMYQVEIVGGETKRLSGKELAAYVVTLDKPRSWQMVFYKPVN